MNDLRLSFGITFKDLYYHEGLKKIDDAYNHFLLNKNSELHSNLQEARNHKISKKAYSTFIIDHAPYLDEFLSEMFCIQEELNKLKSHEKELENIYKCKRLFVQRQSLRDYKSEDWKDFDVEKCRYKVQEILGSEFNELNFSNVVIKLLDNKEDHKDELDVLSKYSAWASLSYEGKGYHKDWLLFKVPEKYEGVKDLGLDEESVNGVNILRSNEKDLDHRDGFSLTSKKYGLKEVLDESHYCIHCHKMEKDSCSKGLNEKNIDTGEISIKKNIFGEDLQGCPLEEKISEMNLLKSQNHHIGSLAAAIIDNPMIAATGHRICNECMKSCIYQKQDSVDIPKIETGTLWDVLNLPWGFEIYRLLTQWNPLKIKDHIAKESTGSKVLVAGLGPAGFTLAHYLLTEGHCVVGIDGLKIEHLEPEISGVDAFGNRVDFAPIKNINSICDDLDERIPYGFGGVSEYGITVRWNKNFLKIIRLILERNKNFRMFGGVRFGSNIDYSSAFDLGFDHIALAIGAGKPNVLDVPNALSIGVRSASDFLMSLQLTGAAKKSSVVNLQIRLPIIVIGGGLTAIDTATESMSYYVRQVEKFSSRHIELVKVYGKDNVEKSWNILDKEIAKEFLDHASLFKRERENARLEGRKPNFVKIIQSLGGVKVVYRKGIKESPSYRLNVEEVDYAFKEGIEFVEHAIPKEILLDRSEYISGIKFSIENNMVTLPARTLLVATGTNPNTVLNKEDPEHFEMDGRYFKILGDGVFLSKGDSSVSIFGDLHPKYKGNVVKAMASAKNHYKSISKILSKGETANSAEFFEKLNNKILANVHKVNILTPNIVEIIFKAPMAANAFQPGQFYKLQNYDQFSIKKEVGEEKTTLLMEGLALTGAWVDKGNGLISTIVLEMGGSSDLCRFLKPGEPVVLMGPTGEPTEIKSNENVMLVGGGLGNAVLFSIGKAFRDAGSRVLYFAGYKKRIDRYKMQEIEN
nr:FAD-dependent oxidoreductase [Alphaproteobacteria bacterium]